MNPEEEQKKEADKEAKKKAKAEQKAAKEAEKERKRQERQQAEQRKLQTAEAPNLTLADFEQYEFGNLFIQSHRQTDRTWASIDSLDLAQGCVWLRARIGASRKQGAKLCFLELRQSLSSLQGVVFGKEIATYAGTLPVESIVDVFVELTEPKEPINSCSCSHLEAQVKKLYAISKALPSLPFELSDASRPEAEVDTENGKSGVSLPTRLDNRIIDLRTPANHAIMRVASGVCMLFRKALHEQDFVEIHTPKMIATASEGGADVFKLGYFGRDAFLAQSPQLYKQMAITSDLERVFEIGPVFRAEKSLTHRHMTEFTGLDMEMAFYDHYSEVLQVLEQTFLSIFDGLNTHYKKEIDTVRKQYPFNDLRYSNPPLRLTYAEAMGILRAEGPAKLQSKIDKLKETGGTELDIEKLEEHKASVQKHPDDEDISTPDERLLGECIAESLQQDFYVIDKFPSAVRPFYTMEDPDDPTWSNSYDIFIRGEEVTSGAQRIHDADMLVARAQKMEVDLQPIQPYVDAFKYGVQPHAGGGIGMERVVMLFLGLHNIRLSSMFPRDPQRLTP